MALASSQSGTRKPRLQVVLNVILVALVMIILACSTRPPERPPVGTPPQAGAESPTETEPDVELGQCDSGDWDIEIVHKRLWRGKPPLKEHWAHVSIANASGDDRWVVFGDRLDQTWKPSARSVSVNELVGEPSGDLYRFGGMDSFKAVRVSTGSTVLLEELPFTSWWEQIPDRVVVTVAVVDAIELDQQAVGDWVGHRPRPAPKKSIANYREYERVSGEQLRNKYTPSVAHREHPPEGEHGLSPERPVTLRDGCALDVVVAFE